MEVEFPSDHLQHDVVSLVAVGVEEERVLLVCEEAHLEVVRARLHVLVLPADVVRDATLPVKRRTLTVWN